MSKSVKIQGLKKFMRKANREGPALDQAIDKEINLSALRMEKCAKEFAPWDTGWLSNNVYADNVGFLQAEVISPAEYSTFVEHGIRYMFTQPFLFPAVRVDWPSSQKRLIKLMRG